MILWATQGGYSAHFSDEDGCRAFVGAVRKRGIRHITTARELFAGGEIEHCYAAMMADRYLPTTGAHWATEFRAMIGHVGIDARTNPWSHSPGRDYREGFMDESLAILRRIALVQTNPRLEPVHCEAIARALAEADSECADEIFDEPVPEMRCVVSSSPPMS